MHVKTPLILLAGAAALTLPSGARATTACTFDAQAHVATAIVTGTQQQLVVSRQAAPQTALMVSKAPCGAATVDNTHLVQVDDQTGGGLRLQIDEANGPLTPTAPGKEVGVQFHGHGGGDTVDVLGTQGPDHVTAGQAGLNLDSDEALPYQEADVQWDPGLTGVSVDGRLGDDTLSAQGGAGTGKPLAVPAGLFGAGGDDTLLGGNAADLVYGGADDDVMAGYDGPDQLDPYLGDDTVGGGAGFDEIQYDTAPAGVTVDLAAGTATGGAGTDGFVGIEAVGGSEFADTLRGDGQANLIKGYDGADAIDGRGGSDDLRGGDDPDVIEARDGRADHADCGAGSDVANLDALDGADGCEAGARPVKVVPTPAPTPAPRGEADRTPPVLRVARADRRRLRGVRRHGLRLRVSCSEACTVSGRLRRRRGRLAARRLGTAPVLATVRLSARGRRALRHRRHATVRLVVTARDAAGNAATRRLRVRL